MEVMRRPKELTARDRMRANVAKNCLIVTLMSLEVGYGSILERYRQERSMSPPELNSVILTDEELSTRLNEIVENDRQSKAGPAAMPPPTRLSGFDPEPVINNVGMTGGKDANLKMYHVMSVKQTLGRTWQNMPIILAAGLLIGHDLTCDLCQCNLNLWSCML